MRIKLTITIIFMLALMCLPSFSVGAVPACPEPFEYLQPDGTVVELYTFGDESYNFTGDKDGYLMEKDENGTYVYITDEKSPALFSASADGTRPLNAVKGFDLRDKYAVDFNDGQPSVFSIKSENLQYSSSESVVSDNSSVHNLIVIAVDYNDVQINDSVWTKDIYNNRFFSTEDGVYSVANYYDEVSGGRAQFVPAFTMTDAEKSQAGTYGKITDGVIKVKVDTNHNNDGTVSNIATLSRPMIANIMPVADTYIDFSAYDTNGDGLITNDELLICFVVAGYEASITNSVTTQEMWGHKWYLDYDMYCDGVKMMYNHFVSGYIMIGATMYQANIPSSVGIFCHELGHLAFGFPDLYSASGADYSDIGYASLMNKGNWGMESAAVFNGTHPTHLDPWCIIQMRWYDDDDIIEIDEKDIGTYDVVSSLSQESGPRFIIVTTSADAEEYFVIENRQYEGFDIGLKYNVTEPGIAIWRIDNSMITEDTYVGNKMNTGSTPAIKLMHSGKGFADFYHSKKPFWRKGINKMGFFGNTSYPQSVLNTYTENSVSDVKIDFLSGSDDKMTVKFGGSDVNTMLHLYNGYAKVVVFNNTGTEITACPLIAEYGENCITDVKKYNDTVVSANSYNNTNSLSLGINNEKTYKIFNVNLAGLKPVSPCYDVVR